MMILILDDCGVIYAAEFFDPSSAQESVSYAAWAKRLYTSELLDGFGPPERVGWQVL